MVSPLYRNAVGTLACVEEGEVAWAGLRCPADDTQHVTG